MAPHGAERRSLRVGVAIALVIATVVVAGYWLFQWWSHDFTSVEGMPANEASTKAIDVRLEQSRTLYQLALVFAAALWALVIAKRDETRISFADTPELTMFVVSSCLLLMSVVWHELFIGGVAEAFQLSADTAQKGTPTSVPDVFKPRYNHMFVAQWQFLLAGASATAITLVSAHHMRTP